MDAMYLSDKKNGVDRVSHDHEELEVLLESFSKQYEEIVNESENIEVILLYNVTQAILTVIPHRPTFIQRRKSWS
jgi:hypothetical protein